VAEETHGFLERDARPLPPQRGASSPTYADAEIWRAAGLELKLVARRIRMGCWPSFFTVLDGLLAELLHCSGDLSSFNN
jgi:hypothetical protein